MSYGVVAHTFPLVFAFIGNAVVGTGLLLVLGMSLVVGVGLLLISWVRK